MSAQPSLFAGDGAGPYTTVRFQPTFEGWRAAARRCLAERLAPDTLWWEPDPTAALERPTRPAARVSPRFVRLAERAACHRDERRWHRLYRVLWRLTHDEPRLLGVATDPDVAELERWDKAVRRDMHKMKAFVRFRSLKDRDGERFVAWFEPDHRIVRATAGFFRRRFTAMRWSILTPDDCAHWDGTGEVWFTAGASRGDAVDDDPVEAVWKTYFRHIFNPARVKLDAMRAEMPVKYWKNLPEAELIAPLVRDAARRVGQMVDAPAAERRLNCGPRPVANSSVPTAAGLDTLPARLAACERCALSEPATQPVPGEGPADARIVIVGEQPGDVEDRIGRPFRGPAGDVLNQALALAGIDRSTLYVTNAVKHFKFRPRGKRRLHQRPSPDEIRACLPWLEEELDAVEPDIVLCLGATAAQAVLGRSLSVQRYRGRVLGDASRPVVVTVHPAWLLRLPAAQREGELRRFVADLASVRQLVN